MIWTKVAFVVATAVLPLSSLPAQSTQSRPAQIILIRHADKPDDPDNPHLSPAGVARAEQLVSFITTDPGMSKFGAPVAVFATRSTNDGNGQRTQETVAPLARAIKVRVQTPYTGKNFALLAKEILSTPAYAGKTVLISWNHTEITQLAAALGVTVTLPKWKARVFDQVYVISYQGTTAMLTTSHYGS